jgi:F-type H+-transporting ATPase subunit epsilon
VLLHLVAAGCVSVGGELGILPRHVPLIVQLKAGETRIKLLDDTEVIMATTTGYMSVEDDRVLIMVEQAEMAGQIDRARAEEALRLAEEALQAAGDDADAKRTAEAARKRAENRLKVVDKQS